MKLVHRQRPSIRSLRKRVGPADDAKDALPARTRCAMHKRGGMERIDRDGASRVLRPGSRFRVPQAEVDDAWAAPVPASLPFRVCKGSIQPSQRMAGQPALRVRVKRGSRGPAYRVLVPATTRLRARPRSARSSGPDPRYRLAGRGGPMVILSKDERED